MNYDSLKGTIDHINSVRSKINLIIQDLLNRSLKHDMSKTESPEKEGYDEFTPMLRTLVYGSDEYWEMLKKMKPFLEHHYENNSHHPEYYLDGINGMNLLDLIEMMCDWKSAGERHPGDNSIVKSIEINAKRFGISDQLKQILLNTASYMEWI